MRSRLNASPGSEPETICRARVLARSNRVSAAAFVPMLNEASITMTRCNGVRARLCGAMACTNGSAKARAAKSNSSVRTANSTSCSSRIRREFFRAASSRNRIAAQFVSRNVRRCRR